MERGDPSDRAFTRRRFLAAGLGAGAMTLAGGAFAGEGAAAAPSPRKMTIDLDLGSIGHGGSLRETVDLAARHGFGSVTVSVGEIERLRPEEIEGIRAEMAAKGIVFGSAGLPFEVGREEERFEADLAKLPAQADALRRAGIGRVFTWISPSSRSRTYLQNFRLHAGRLAKVAGVLEPRGIRLGLEYVAPRTSWARSRFPFIHSMAEMKDLIGEIGRPNVGLVLDSWHWYTGRETEADILSLRGQDIVLVHLDDAVTGKEIDEQVDGRRDLPCATGVIDVGTFLSALNRIGYDGPVYAEPFLAELGKLPREEAVARTAAAMKKAFALIR